MNAKEELNKLENEMDEFLKPREKRRRELNYIIEKEFIESQQKLYNDTIAGRLFYGDGETWSGYADTIYLIKPISCEDWSDYNSCNVFQIEIRLEKKSRKMHTFMVKTDTSRVSNFKTHYKELTPEMFEQIRELLDKEILGAFIEFKDIYKS